VGVPALRNAATLRADRGKLVAFKYCDFLVMISQDPSGKQASHAATNDNRTF